MEEKWKTNNPLPPLRLPLYKGISNDLVEVEAKLDNKIYEDNSLMQLADKLVIMYLQRPIYVYAVCMQKISFCVKR